jgi:hypothetical protein
MGCEEKRLSMKRYLGKCVCMTGVAVKEGEAGEDRVA